MLLLFVQKDRFNFRFHTHWIILSFCYTSAISYYYSILLLQSMNTKKLFITAFFCYKNEQKGFHITLPGVYVGTCIQAVTKASSVLGHIFHEAILSEESSPKPKLRSSNNARVSVNSVAPFHVKGGYLGVILTNVSKCERNRNPTKDQYVTECPSYGIYDWTKTFCDSKNWWNIHPVNSDGSSDVQNIHWGHRFKRLHEKGKIKNNTLKMADNNLR